MDDRVMIKATTTEHCVCFRTVSAARKSPRSFYIQRDDLLKLRQHSYLVVNDIHCFAEIYREIDARVTIRFYWLSEHGGDGKMDGWNQIVTLPLGKLLDFAERGGIGDNPGKWTVLSLKDTYSPKIVFVDTRNLKQAVANLTIRHKLAKFLSENFHYRNATEIRLFNDFVPYSFFFREMRNGSEGMCGGVILHGQNDLKKAKYSIHT